MMRRRRGPSLIGVAATTAVVVGTAGAVKGHQANKAADQQQQAAYEAQQQQAAMEAAAAQAGRPRPSRRGCSPPAPLPPMTPWPNFRSTPR